MTKDPFENFNTASVRASTSVKVLNESAAKINPKSLNLALKYGALFTISIFFSLSVCPQKGVGFLNTDFPFFHHLLHQSEVLCGLYCGFVFFTTTHLLTFFLLTHFEKVKITKHLSFLPAILTSAFWGLSMTSLFSNSTLGWRYNISWLLIIAVFYTAANNLFLTRLKKTQD